MIMRVTRLVFFALDGFPLSAMIVMVWRSLAMDAVVYIFGCHTVWLHSRWGLSENKHNLVVQSGLRLHVQLLGIFPSIGLVQEQIYG